MFTSINENQIQEIHALRNLERSQLLEIYTYGLKTKNYKILDGYVIKSEENKESFLMMKRFLACNHLKTVTSKEFVKMYPDIWDDEFIVVRLLEKVLDEENYVRANNLIAFCIKKKFYNYKFYKMKKRFYKERRVRVKVLDNN